MATIYTDGTYLEQNPNWHQGDSAWKAGHIQALLERNGITEPKSICEVGCGAGEILRVLSDRPRKPAKFLILGSADPRLVRGVSESLAGRVSHVDVGGFDLSEAGANRFARL